MKRYAMMVVVIVMALFIVGCDKKTDSDTTDKDKKNTGIVTSDDEKDIPKEDYDKPLTREWLKETYKIDDDLLDDYYVDEMINSGEWSVGRMEEEAGNMTELYRIIKSHKVDYINKHKDEIDAANAEKEKLYSRAYLMEGTAFEGDIPNSSELKWVFCQRWFRLNTGGDDNSPDGYFGFMIDFENHKYYLSKLYDENGFPHDYRLGEEIDLADEQMTQVYEWFDAAQIESWDKTQDTDHELWHMGMEYKDGTVVTYTITNDDGKAPLSVLKGNLWDLVDAGKR